MNKHSRIKYVRELNGGNYMLKTKIIKLIAIAEVTFSLIQVSPAMATPKTVELKDAYVNWSYINQDGSWAINQWKQIDGKWYYFGGSGRAVKGCKSIGSNDSNKPFYYFSENGVWDGKGPYSKVEVEKLEGMKGKVEKQVVDEALKEEHSIIDVVNMWNKLKPTFNQNIYIEEPSVEFPYKIGKVDERYLKDTINYLNFVRYLAYIEPVTLDSTLTEHAQYAAVLTAANNKLQHVNPIHPKNMPNDFYNLGKEATSSSNLSGGKLLESIQDCLDEKYNLSGMDNIGHREWLLDPTVTKVGFGTTSNYSAQKLPFGEFATDADVPNYLAWPSEGAFPSNFIDKSVLWSINLNKNVYDLNRIEDISINISRLCDNKQWNLPKVNNFSKSISGFRLSTNDNHGYGSTTLIFHIAFDELNVSEYLGEYKVKISGFKNVKGGNHNIEYTINFFDLDKEILKNN